VVLSINSGESIFIRPSLSKLLNGFRLNLVLSVYAGSCREILILGRIPRIIMKYLYLSYNTNLMTVVYS
jgi:hypothetical protein